MKKKRIFVSLSVAGMLLLVLGGLFHTALAQTIIISKAVIPPEGGSFTIEPSKPAYNENEAITMTATANPGYVFAGWDDTTGQLTGETDEVVLYEVTESATITAMFDKLVVCYTLTRTINPTGSGSVSASSDLTDEACAAGSYPAGAIVTLQATAADGYQFGSWTGATPSAADPKTATVLMDQDRAVTANFAARCQTLSLSRVGLGAVPAAAPPNSPGCAAGLYKLGEVINLTAAPIAGWRVDGWTGTDNDSSTAVTNQLTMPALPATQASHSVVVTYIQRPTLQFSAATFQVNEDDGTATITVTRTGSKTEAVSVDFATGAAGDSAMPGVDYVATSGRLDFASGAETASFPVEILDNPFGGGTVELTLRLSNQTTGAILGAPSTAKLQILDNEGAPQVQFALSEYEVDEGAGEIVVRVNLFPAPTNDVFVDFRTEGVTATPDEDYRPIGEGEDGPRPLRFRVSEGQTTKSIRITIIDDDLDEYDETLNLILQDASGAQLGANANVVLTIIDDDETPAVQLSAGEYFVKEGAASLALPVTLGSPSGRQATVGYEVTLARNGSTTSGVLTFPAGTTSQELVVGLAGTSDGDQFTIDLQDAVNAILGQPNSAVLYVLDTDINDCNPLTFTHTGYGQAPAPASKNSSLGCPEGLYVANEQINVLAQPEKGWYIERWQGTVNDASKSLENTVLMPGRPFVVNVDYRVPVYFSVSYGPELIFEGPNEVEPNNVFLEANGPLRHNRTFLGGFPQTSDKEDRFYFNLSAPAEVTVTLDDMEPGQDYNLYVYPENWASGFLGYSGRVGNLKETIVVNLDPGKYYIRVAHASGPPTADLYELGFVVD